MEYFESNINVIRSQIKVNKTYKEISNLFMQRFPEVRRGFSERNLRIFCSKHGISKLNEARDRCCHSTVCERGKTSCIPFIFRLCAVIYYII